MASNTPKFLNLLIPEVNFWINRNLYNNSFNHTFVKCPTKMSDFWRSKDSVVELIFNETADPSGNEYDDGYHFIWKYRTINLDKLHYIEPLLYKRIQIYYNSTWVYAAKDDPKYSDIFNLVNSKYEIDDYEYPYGVKPSKYINYNSHIVTSGSDQLHYDEPPFPESEDDEEVSIYQEAENVFNLTEEELNMLEYLYYYRSSQYELIEPWEEDFYYTLKSPLSKWVYIYLMCYMFNVVNEDYMKTITTKDDGSFRCLCEKHFQDRIYEYVQKQSLVLWEKIIDRKVRDTRSFTPYTLKNNTFLQKGRILNDDISTFKIFLMETTRPPEQYNSFEFILDGVILKNGVDYRIKNLSKESSPKICIEIINKKLEWEIGMKYQFMYNYTLLKTPISGLNELDI